MVDYNEAIADGDAPEPSESVFSFDSGGKKVVYQTTDLTAEDITDEITNIVGTTSMEVGDGRLNRTLPYAHPQFPWLFANNVGIKGVGFTAGDLDVQDVPDDLEAPAITDQWVLYDGYEFTVTFTGRPYSVLSDSSITLTEGSWYPFDDAGSGSATTFEYANEWTRFTDFTIEPQNDYVTGQQGQMRFVTGDTTASPTNPYGVAYTGSPRMRLPNLIHKFIWYGVPLRFITSPDNFFDVAVGCINQNAWDPFNTGAGYDPGQLLLASAVPTIYKPNVPAAFVTEGGNTAFSNEKLCNIVMTFLYTTRTSDNVPTPPITLASPFDPTGAVPNNRNFVIAGWNLLPWLRDRSYYYSISTGQIGGSPVGTPQFYSWPFERLFTDCDA